MKNWQHRMHKTMKNWQHTMHKTMKNWQHTMHKTMKNKTKTQHNTICAGHHNTQVNTNKVNKNYCSSYA